jgi:hypothetical protein
MLKKITLFTAALLVLFAAGASWAERYVVVNNQRLTQNEISQLEGWHCGPIPNGRYWLNINTGIWGYSGNPRAQGHIADNCRNPGPRPGLSQRGQLFTPYDWVR